MRKSIRKLIQGKPVIGEGASRIVYDLGNGYVLKVAKSKERIKYNKREVRNYKLCPSPIRKHLANIIEHGSSWLIMKKYDRQSGKQKEKSKGGFKTKKEVQLAAAEEESKINQSRNETSG